MKSANDVLHVAGRTYDSRLLVGTGKYRDFDETRRAIEASGAHIVTVAIRRTNIGQNAGEPNLLDVLPPSRFTILPNTAGCYTAQDAVPMPASTSTGTRARSRMICRFHGLTMPMPEPMSEASGMIAMQPIFSSSRATIGSSEV